MRLKKSSPNGYVAMVVVVSFSIIMIGMLQVAVKRSQQGIYYAAQANMKSDYAQRENLILNEVVRSFPEAVRKSMGDTNPGIYGNIGTWNQFFNHCITSTGAGSTKIADGDLTNLYSANGIRANTARNTNGAVTIQITDLSGNVNSVTEGITANNGIFNSAYTATKRVYPIRGLSGFTPATTKPELSHDLKFTGSMYYNGSLVTYNSAKYCAHQVPNIKMGAFQSGDYFVAKRNWWAFRVNYGTANDPNGRSYSKDYILSLYEVPSQLALESTDNMLVDTVTNTLSTITGTIHSSKLDVAAAASLASIKGLSAKHDLTLAAGSATLGNTTVANVDLTSSSQYQSSVHNKKTAKGINSLPITIGADSGRYNYTVANPAMNGASGISDFFDNTATNSWQNYSRAYDQANLKIIITQVAGSPPTPTEFLVTFKNPFTGANITKTIQNTATTPTLTGPLAGASGASDTIAVKLAKTSTALPVNGTPFYTDSITGDLHIRMGARPQLTDDLSSVSPSLNRWLVACCKNTGSGYTHTDNRIDQRTVALRNSVIYVSTNNMATSRPRLSVTDSYPRVVLDETNDLLLYGANFSSMLPNTTYGLTFISPLTVALSGEGFNSQEDEPTLLQVPTNLIVGQFIASIDGSKDVKMTGRISHIGAESQASDNTAGKRITDFKFTPKNSSLTITNNGAIADLSNVDPNPSTAGFDKTKPYKYSSSVGYWNNIEDFIKKSIPPVNQMHWLVTVEEAVSRDAN
jgi:hypothetical protein